MAFVIRPIASSTRKALIWNFRFDQILQKSCNIDKIDCFTTNLMCEKFVKWKNINKNINSIIEKKSFKQHNHNVPLNVLVKGLLNDIENIDSLSSIELDVSKLSINQLNSLILATIRTKNEVDFYYIIKQCLQNKILPDLTYTLAFLSSNGNVKVIKELEGLYNGVYKGNNSKFLPYIGYAFWRKGNVDLAINTFKDFFILHKQEIYKSNPTKQDICHILKLTINETLSCKGEAVLYSFIKLAKELHSEYNEIFLLVVIWKKAFESNWFSDQNLAISIFEDNEDLREIISKESIKLCHNLLELNNVEAVYRLIELFLKYERKNAYQSCLKMLFDYYYYRKDVRACTEIIKFFQALDIPVTATQNEKLLNLLLRQSFNINNAKLYAIKENEFQYKF